MDIRHENNRKDINISSVPYNPELFHNDKDFYLAYKKTEHIVSAIFLVTGLIEDDELTRDSIRKHALFCLSKVITLTDKNSISVTDIQILANQIRHLSALLDIGFWAGKLSQMNVSILQNEIHATYKLINDMSMKYKNSMDIASSFFVPDQVVIESAKIQEQILVQQQMQKKHYESKVLESQRLKREKKIFGDQSFPSSNKII
jgi:hypothetical protein